MSGIKPNFPSEWADEYPFLPQYKSLACGHAMSYLDEGEGHAVIMVHGNPTWSFYYRNVVKTLSDRYRCIVPDHIGCGLSDKPGEDEYAFTLEQRIQDLGELVDSLGIERFDLVVHDWGGAIGLGMALRRFDKLRRVMILNTAAFTDDRIPKRIAMCRWPFIGKFLVQGLNGFAWPATWMAVSKRKLPKAIKKAFLFPYAGWHNRTAVYRFVKDIPMDELHPSWATLKAVEKDLPRLRERDVAIMWGGQDFCFNGR
ncbi:MAG: alpha/beta fold hydrolase, partial [Verrucomicrobiota bacterium]